MNSYSADNTFQLLIIVGRIDLLCVSNLILKETEKMFKTCALLRKFNEIDEKF